ncbi:MAG: GAF and ANTAR domain-containing protein [Actinobacteria bacterium]|nr:GAF and ANTAR domain-containing protein [Actinomycetota bacterium]
MGEQKDPHRAESFVDIARVVLAEPGSLSGIAATAVHLIPGCEHASVCLIEGRAASSHTASDELGARVCALQFELDEGPCVDAVRKRDVLEVTDLATDDRWESFAGRAVEEMGVRGVLSFPLFVHETTLGAFSLYATQPNAFPGYSRAIGAVYAAHASVAAYMSQRVSRLTAALESRATIDQAKGIIMATMGCTPDEAFELLRQQSQALNWRLRDIAAEIVERQRSSRRDQEPPS